jgi:hypothetical protein
MGAKEGGREGRKEGGREGRRDGGREGRREGGREGGEGTDRPTNTFVPCNAGHRR